VEIETGSKNEEAGEGVVDANEEDILQIGKLVEEKMPNNMISMRKKGYPPEGELAEEVDMEEIIEQLDDDDDDSQEEKEIEFPISNNENIEETKNKISFPFLSGDIDPLKGPNIFDLDDKDDEEEKEQEQGEGEENLADKSNNAASSSFISSSSSNEKIDKLSGLLTSTKSEANSFTEKTKEAPLPMDDVERKGKLVCNGQERDSEIIYWKIVPGDKEFESPITPHHAVHTNSHTHTHIYIHIYHAPFPLFYVQFA
jgi:hypothetical protein